MDTAEPEDSEPPLPPPSAAPPSQDCVAPCLFLALVRNSRGSKVSKGCYFLVCCGVSSLEDLCVQCQDFSPSRAAAQSMQASPAHGLGFRV